MAKLIAFDSNHNLQFEGYCKLSINKLSSQLIIEPKNEDFKIISASFQLKYAMQKETENYTNLIENRILIPIFNKIKESPSKNSELIEIIAKWISILDENLKEYYINLLKETNTFKHISPWLQKYECKRCRSCLENTAILQSGKNGNVFVKLLDAQHDCPPINDIPQLEYSKIKTISLCRKLMMEDDENIFGTEKIKVAKQKQTRILEQQLPKLFQKKINVHYSEIPVTIWRCTLIEDEEDFKKMLPLLEYVSTNAKYFSIVCNAYVRRRAATLKFAQIPTSKYENIKDFAKKFYENVKGHDWQYLLKQKEAYNFDEDEQKQKSFIMGFEESKKEESDKKLEEFLSSKIASRVSNKKIYTSIQKRQIYLQSKFRKWNSGNYQLSIVNNNNETRTSSRKKSRYSICNKKNCQQFKKDQMIESIKRIAQNLKNDPSLHAAFESLLQNQKNGACSACIEEICKTGNEF
uniref:Uncharacterized protein n=1 Tax=Panagrolaimus davidi TaxID=227884 RepID=A0A914QF41_9BILA